MYTFRIITPIFSVLFQEIVVVVKSCKSGLTKMEEQYTCLCLVCT